jgi:hypothetical protein
VDYVLCSYYASDYFSSWLQTFNFCFLFAIVLLNAGKDIRLALNAGNTKYMDVGRRQGMMAN